MDKLTKEQRRKNMQAVKSKGSKIESLLTKELWKRGYRYRKNFSKIFGKPDISITNLKLAIFCDSEFWHGKDWYLRKNDIKSNRDFWHKKIENNISRDKEVNKVLKEQGWTVLRFWGKDILKNTQKCIDTIEETIKKIKESKKYNYSELRQKLGIDTNKCLDNSLSSLTHYIQVADTSISYYYEQEAKEYLKNQNIKDNFQQFLLPLNWDIPFPPSKEPKFYFIDLFAGIGGFRIALQNLGGKCVFSSEIDAQAKKSYESNFGEIPFGDITKIDEKKIPEHDILTAGFPCQAFSIAGKRAGFEDIRGTLFFDVARIIKEKKPKAFFLENVKGLINHDKGKTLSIILDTLRNKLGYFVPEPKVINAKDFGVPQNRERIFIVGFRKDLGVTNFEYPEPLGLKVSFSDIKEENPVSVKYYLSTQYYQTLINHKLRHANKGNGFGFNIVKDNEIANAIVVGGMGKERNLVIDDRLTDFIPITKIKGEVNREGIRKMTPREWARLQGFPDNFKITVSDAQAYKQFGNSVAIPAIQSTAQKIINKILEKI